LVEVNAPAEPDDRGLDEKGERSVREREVAVGMLAKWDAEAGVKEVGQVPEGRDMGILQRVKAAVAMKRVKAARVSRVRWDRDLAVLTQ
jgi:hypothetical protein